MAVLLPEDEDIHVVRIEPYGLQGLVGLPADATGLIIFAHGSGNGRLSPRNQHVASMLRRARLATLLMDLLLPKEEQDRANVFNVDLLASRLIVATRWTRRIAELADLPIGYFGASTGAVAALVAAAQLGSDIGAVVSRGGRPDLAGNALGRVLAPTLLIVGGADAPVIPLNQSALERLNCEKKLAIVPGAGHLFEELGTLDQAALHAQRWFREHLTKARRAPAEPVIFQDRRDAGFQLAAALQNYKASKPIVLALPRGGVPVAFEVAKALDAPLDVVLVRKIGAPGHPEFGLGAVVDGADPQLVLNQDVIQYMRASPSYVEEEKNRQLEEIERRRRLYRPDRPPLAIKNRTVIVVDDGIATGGTMKAVLKALSRARPSHLVLAVPVAPRETIEDLSADADDIVCLSTPEPFHAVGPHYRDFTQTTDREVVDLLQRSLNQDRETYPSARQGEHNDGTKDIRSVQAQR